MTGRRPFRMAVMNFGMTAAYWDSGARRGPKILKYLSATVLKPYTQWKTPHYCSAESFERAYGESGSGFISSCLGSTGVSPYTDELDANTTLRTPKSRAASRTFRVPVILDS